MHVQNLAYCLEKENEHIVVDGSDTGTGKTYCSLAIAKQLGYTPLIVCPKTLLSNWQKVCKIYKIKPLTIVNYETIKNGKQYQSLRDKSKRINCPYLNIITNNQNNKKTFRWNLPDKTLVIFDEAHKCKIKYTQNSEMIVSLKDYIRNKHSIRVMLLSATLTDKPKDFLIFGYLLGFFREMKKGRTWIKGIIRDSNLGKMSALHEQVFPKKGSRMRISDLGDQFPSNLITADCYDLDEKDEKEVNANYSIMESIMKEVDSGNNDAIMLVKLQKARQLIERKKVSILSSLAKDYMDEGKSVVIFVNFIDTIKDLMQELDTDCVLYGAIEMNDRMNNVRRFQSNESQIIICNSMIGGVGISLEDTRGEHQRVSLISPSYSSTSLIQCLGRICRASSKSPSIQKIIFCSNTVEEDVCEKLNDKLEFLSELNDGDITPYGNHNYDEFDDNDPVYEFDKDCSKKLAISEPKKQKSDNKNKQKDDNKTTILGKVGDQLTKTIDNNAKKNGDENGNDIEVKRMKDKKKKKRRDIDKEKHVVASKSFAGIMDYEDSNKKKVNKATGFRISINTGDESGDESGEDITRKKKNRKKKIFIPI
jgi:superfamily II DNA or RNA helicase